MKEFFFITTPIYYVNGEPHLGHFYCTIAADIIANYYRQKDRNVFFTTGTDEHGQKAEKSAKENNQNIQDYVNEMSQVWKTLWDKFEISFDDFIRTSEERHLKVVAEFTEKLFKKGDIYAGHYEGWYCTPCESFWLKSQLIDGKCPNNWCKRETVWVKEDGYYFALSKYQNKLLEYLKKNPSFILPKTKYNEVLSFVKAGLQDIYITRNNIHWGINFPGKNNKILYVWFDALLNYLTVARYPKGNYELRTTNYEFKNIWPPDVHLIGKDILRFHAVIWSAMLLAAEVELPKCILTHGFWNLSGEKMSKSKGEVFTPEQLINNLSLKYKITENIATDVLRYFLIAEATFGLDGNFSLERLYRRYEYDLANDLGNLVSRVLMLNDKFLNNNSLPLDKDNKYLTLIRSEIHTLNQELELIMKNYALTESLNKIFDFIKSMNINIEKWKPWKVAKENILEAQKIIFALIEGLGEIAKQIFPFMPNVSKKINNLLKANIKSNDLRIIFPKEKQKDNSLKIENKNTPEEITLDDFKKLQLVIGEVLEAEEIPNTDKLLKLKVDIGSEVRQLVAGIAKYYNPETLIHKKIIVLANLKPAKLRGEISQGMVLAAVNENELYLLVPDGNINNGSKIS